MKPAKTWKIGKRVAVHGVEGPCEILDVFENPSRFVMWHEKSGTLFIGYKYTLVAGGFVSAFNPMLVHESIVR